MALLAIQSLVSLLLVAAIALPGFLAFRGTKLPRCVLTGWLLFVLAFLFQDVIAPLLAWQFAGKEAAASISPEQPGTVGAIFGGWLLPLLVSLVSRKLGQLRAKRAASSYPSHLDSET